MAQEHGRLLELLRTASPDSVVALVKSLRGSESHSSHLSDLRAGLAPAHPPLHMDLNFRYPNAFAVLEPLHTANVDFRLIDVNKSPAITTRDAHKRSRTCGPWTTKLGTQGSPYCELPSTVSRLPTAESMNYVDPRLQNLDIGQWTSVSVSDSFAAQAISFYLSNEHPYLALFDPDLFLEDLTTGKGPFCTELLVSSLLAWSCVCADVAFHSNEPPQPTLTLPLTHASSRQATPNLTQKQSAFPPFFLTKGSGAGMHVVRMLRTCVLSQLPSYWP